jgi:hypothetical protein
MPRAATLRIFLADGSPEGLRLVEKSNWTGHALVCPRSRFSTARDRKEFNRPGVYVLTGLTPDSGLPRVYIGEGDPVRPRLDSHQRDKDFWTTLTLFTSGTENLNKAHIQFLESRLIELARAAKRADLDNQNSPQLPNLSEADHAEMETFLEEMLLIYPVLGLTAFESVKPQQPASTKLWIRAKGVTASGFDTAAGFIVTRGSQAVIEWVPSAHEYAKELRDHSSSAASSPPTATTTSSHRTTPSIPLPALLRSSRAAPPTAASTGKTSTAIPSKTSSNDLPRLDRISL